MKAIGLEAPVFAFSQFRVWVVDHIAIPPDDADGIEHDCALWKMDVDLMIPPGLMNRR